MAQSLRLLRPGLVFPVPVELPVQAVEEVSYNVPSEQLVQALTDIQPHHAAFTEHFSV